MLKRRVHGENEKRINKNLGWEGLIFELFPEKETFHELI